MSPLRSSRCSCSPYQVGVALFLCPCYTPPPLLLKGVAPDRQKVMIGGMTLSDTEWGRAKSKIKEVWWQPLQWNFQMMGDFVPVELSFRGDL